MEYTFLNNNFLNYFEQLTVSYHPRYLHRPWFLNSKRVDLRLDFNNTVCRTIKLSTQDFGEAMKLFDGELNGTSVFFKDYDNAESAKEWIISMVTMSKLQEKAPSL